MKYKTIYGFVLTLMEKEQVFNALEESAERTFNLNKLVSAICNNKSSIPLLNEPHKAPVMK